MTEQLPSSRADQLIPACLQEPTGGPENEQSQCQTEDCSF